jgi:prophage regulatory protein
MGDRVVRERERRDLTGISRSRWFELERIGQVPRRRQLAPGGAVGWLESELNNWISTRPVVGGGTGREEADSPDAA